MPHTLRRSHPRLLTARSAISNTLHGRSSPGRSVPPGNAARRAAPSPGSQRSRRRRVPALRGRRARLRQSPAPRHCPQPFPPSPTAVFPRAARPCRGRGRSDSHPQSLRSATVLTVQGFLRYCHYEHIGGVWGGGRGGRRLASERAAHTTSDTRALPLGFVRAGVSLPATPPGSPASGATWTGPPDLPAQTAAALACCCRRPPPTRPPAAPSPSRPRRTPPCCSRAAEAAAHLRRRRRALRRKAH